MRGTPGSEYEGGKHRPCANYLADKIGLYHLRILLPPSYPMSAPDILFMTPNGRFELGKKVPQSDCTVEPEGDELISDLY
jgi:ubiquitin-conjugating enzyme E2 J1